MKENESRESEECKLDYLEAYVRFDRGIKFMQLVDQIEDNLIVSQTEIIKNKMILFLIKKTDEAIDNKIKDIAFMSHINNNKFQKYY